VLFLATGTAVLLMLSAALVLFRVGWLFQEGVGLNLNSLFVFTVLLGMG
jgi:hypothetical protein